MNVENKANSGVRPKTASTPIRKVAGTSIVSTPSSTRPKSAVAQTTPFSPSSGSVCSSSAASSARETAKHAKLVHTAERVKKVGELRDKWCKEKETKLAHNAERRALELKRLQDLAAQAAEQRRSNAEKMRDAESRQRQARLDSLQTSVQERAEQAAELAQAAKERRRMSVMLNTEIHTKAMQNEKRIKKQQKEGEDDILAHRRADMLAAREAKRADEVAAREALAQRTAEAARAREVETSLAQEKQERERELIESRHHAWQDEQAAKKQEARAHKEDLSARLDEWRAHRTIEETASSAEREAQRDQLDARRSDWQNLQAYKKSQHQRDRQSIAARLQTWRDDKTAEGRQRQEAEERLEVERELKAAEQEDTRAYAEKQRRCARESLCYRLEKGHLDKVHEEGEEEYRRAVEARDRLESTQAWQDARAAREAAKQRARESLANVLVKARAEHEADLEAHNAALEAMHADLALRRADWLDRNAAKQADSRNRRMSVAVRLDSWREQRMAEEKWKAAQQAERDEDARLREEDHQRVNEHKADLKAAELADRLGGMLL